MPLQLTLIISFITTCILLVCLAHVLVLSVAGVSPRLAFHGPRWMPYSPRFTLRGLKTGSSSPGLVCRSRVLALACKQSSKMAQLSMQRSVRKWTSSLSWA